MALLFATTVGAARLGAAATLVGRPPATALAPLLHGVRVLSSSAAASSNTTLRGGGAPLGAAADAFTAAAQQRTEEELRRMTLKQGKATVPDAEAATSAGDAAQELPPHGKREVGGYAGPEPTRYQDWEIKGRCSDF